MATGSGREYRRPCQDNEEKCVFCENLVSQKNMKRHLTGYCEIAKAECHGKDILKEAELRSAKKRGLGDLRSLFQKSKSARTGHAGIASDHRPDGEELLLGDGDEGQMEVDNLNNQILNQGVYEGNQREELEEEEEEEANIQNPSDESVILEKLEALNIGMSEGFNSIYQRLGEIEKERRKELPPLAKPEDLDPQDERYPLGIYSKLVTQWESSDYVMPDKNVFFKTQFSCKISILWLLFVVFEEDTHP